MRVVFVILWLVAVAAAATEEEVVSGPFGCRKCKPYDGPTRNEQYPEVAERDWQQHDRTSFSEGFEAAVPPGWLAVRRSEPLGYSGVFQGSVPVFPAQAGTNSSYAGMNYNSGAGLATISTWLITPPLSIRRGTTLTFWTRTVTNVTFADRLQVRMSTNGDSSDVGTSSTSVGDFTELLQDINPGLTLTGYPNVWTAYTVTVLTGPLSFTGRFAFRYFVPNGGPGGVNGDYIGIDTVSVADTEPAESFTGTE